MSSPTSMVWAMATGAASTVSPRRSSIGSSPAKTAEIGFRSARHSARGLVRSGCVLLLRRHRLGEALEQIMAVLRTGRGFRVVLHREHRLAFDLQAAIAAVEQGDVGFLHAFRQRRGVDSEA